MKKIFLFAAMLSLTVACSNDDNNEAGPKPDNQKELIETIADDLTGFIEGQKDVTYEQIQQLLSKYSSDLTSVVEDDMMYITDDEGRELQIDLHGVTRIADSDEEPISDEELEEIYDEMSKALEIPELTTNNISAQRVARTGSPSYAGSTDVVTLTKPDILLWAPFGEATPAIDKIRSKLASSATANGLFLTKKLGNSCTLESMGQFANYSVVVLACHGNKRGELCLPLTDYWKKKFGHGASGRMIVKTTTTEVNGRVTSEKRDTIIEEIILTKADLQKALPSLNGTILWTIMCYADVSNSAIKAVARQKKVAAFTGANNTVDGVNPINFFSLFAAKFFNNGKGGSYVPASFRNSLGTLNKSYKYKSKKTGKWVYGDYSLDCSQSVLYKRPSADGLRYRMPLGSAYSPYGSAPYRARGLKGLQSSSDGIEEGFLITNLETREVFEVPYTASSVERVGSASYSDLTTRHVYCFNTSNLAAGEYEYCTYLKANGQTIKSDRTYQFKKDNGLCPDDNHPHAIDMGAAGVWACCNVGASRPEEYGGYYAWGELEEKSSYTEQTYKYWTDLNGDGKYNYGEFAPIGSDIGGNSAYDVATAKWGGAWRMPSLAQMEKLRDNCPHEWTQVNGVNGMMFTATNGNRLFLPAAGNRYGTSLYDAGFDGYYSSGTLASGYQYEAYYLSFNSGGVGVLYGRYYLTRGTGLTVRPVRQ